MYEVLLTVMLILSVFIIIVIAMQPTKTQSASNAFMGGASQLFGKQKARGFEAVLIKTTVVSLILFFVLSFLLTRFF
ncbi:MAG: preprotein translocase subunit SecG [Alkalibacterium sp.]|nr:preprotein translocase subunit SecG [Alkalibacterium sp.]